MELLTDSQKSETIKHAVNNLAVQLSSVKEHVDDSKTNREKFQSIYEVDHQNINTDEINTDEITPDEITTKQQLKTTNNHSDNIQTSIYEFSVSTLDRKLKEIKRNKHNKYTKTRCNSLDNVHRKKMSLHLNQDQVSDKINNITIMMNPSKLINEHLNEIQLRIIGHTRAAIMYGKREKIIGYPVTILSSFITSAIMMSITSDSLHNKEVIKYISLTLSIISFLFSVSRDYLNFARKFQSHDLSSKLYTTLLRSTEVRLIKNHLSKDDKRDVFKDIVDQMSIIEQYETPIPVDIDNKIRKDHIELNS